MTPDIAMLLSRIPEQNGFPGPDEVERRLAAVAHRYPDLVRRRRVGTSRLGQPIHMLSIGSGPRDALVFAGPHPNEPVGFLTVPYLAELLCADDGLRERLGLTWHLIGCVDPDGARLNEEWYAGPLTRRHYARRFYRPPYNAQVEWTFPVPGRQSHAELPETRALMDVIDGLRPDLMCSLHNAEFGGVYYYVTEERPGMADALSNLSDRTGIPVNLAGAEADVPGARRAGPCVFVMPPPEEVDHALTSADDASMGASSLHYAGRHGTLSLIVEVPLWADDRCADGGDSGRAHADVLRTAAGMLEGISPRLGVIIDPAIGSLAAPGSPFAVSLAGLRHTTAALANTFRCQADDAGDAPSTVAQRFTVYQIVHMLRLRAAGTALRLIDGELAVGNHGPAVRAARPALADLFDAWADEAEDEAPGTPVPLPRLLGAQLVAILTAAAY